MEQLGYGKTHRAVPTTVCVFVWTVSALAALGVVTLVVWRVLGDRKMDEVFGLKAAPAALAAVVAPYTAAQAMLAVRGVVQRKTGHVHAACVMSWLAAAFCVFGVVSNTVEAVWNRWDLPAAWWLWGGLTIVASLAWAALAFPVWRWATRLSRDQPA
jgi:hypothetical protein